MQVWNKELCVAECIQRNKRTCRQRTNIAKGSIYRVVRQDKALIMLKSKYIVKYGVCKEGYCKGRLQHVKK